MLRKETGGITSVALAFGAAAGAAVAAYGVLQAVRALRSQRAGTGPVGPLEVLEESAVELLRRDPVTGACAIDVAAVGPGMVELTGTVPTQEAGQRAARLLHALAGVRTVINRVEVGAFQRRAAEYRAREAAGDPSVHETHWTGVGVGMGGRRQGNTEPDRPDDSRHRIDRQLEVTERDVAEGAEAAGVSGDNEGTPHTTD